MGDIYYMNSAFVIAARAAEHVGHRFLEQSLASPKAIPVGGRREGGQYDAETAAYVDFQQAWKDNVAEATGDGGISQAKPLD